MVLQGEIEHVQDASLQIGVEVHQRVPANEQVEPTDRRVVRQIVATEVTARRGPLRNAKRLPT